jgi:hypothetical protein
MIMYGQIYGRVESLEKDKYDAWRMQVEALFIRNEPWEYVTGEKSKPEGAGSISVEALEAWRKTDRKARSDLILCIDPSELK